MTSDSPAVTSPRRSTLHCAGSTWNASTSTRCMRTTRRRRWRRRCASSTTRCAPARSHYFGLSNFTGWQLQRAVDLAEFRGLAAPGHAAAAVQPAGPRDRVGGRAGRAARARAAAVVPARRRLADRQVQPGGGAHRGDPAGREPRPRCRGVRPPQQQRTHLGRRRRRTCDRRRAECHDGAGRAGLVAGPARRDLGDPRRPDPRAARRQPGIGRRARCRPTTSPGSTPPATPALPTIPTAARAPSSAAATSPAAADSSGERQRSPRSLPSCTDSA